METQLPVATKVPWNKGKLVGQKAPLTLRDIWAIRVRLQISKRARELALFNLAIDCKLRGCDLVALHVRDVSHGKRMASRAMVMQQKTQRTVQFEITQQTRDSLAEWIKIEHLKGMISCFRTACIGWGTYQHDSTPVFWRVGSRRLA